VSGGLRVALLAPSDAAASRDFVEELAAGLRERGQSPEIIANGGWPALEGQLRRRMFEDNLTLVPSTYAALRRGGYELAHATHAAGALAASLWARRAGRPVVYTYLGVPRREELPARRLRLGVLERALRSADATAVTSEEAREAMRRWLGTEARVIPSGPALVEEYERLYGELL
jgi:Glycosyltransferase Family 4